MNVKQLIELLQQYPDDAAVLVYDDMAYEDGVREIKDVGTSRLPLFSNFCVIRLTNE